MLDGTIEDDSFFGYICGLDEGDDWTNPGLWIKANPNLDVTVKTDDLMRKFRKARESPTASALKRKECYGGLDLAPKRDLSSLVLVFPVEDHYKVLPYFWMPEENVRENERRDRLPYSQWIRQGLITATEGNVTDYEAIRETLKKLEKKYEIQEIAFDPFGATELVTKLMRDHFKMIEFRQTIQAFNEPTQKFEALITAGRIEHAGHPILRAHAQAVTVKTDLNENIRPVKDKTTGRIDGIVALIMALSRAILQREDSDYPRAFVLEW